MKKGWRKSESKRTDWRSRKTGKYDIGSPERMPAQSPERNQAQSPERMPAQSPERKQARSPERMPAQSPERKQARSPERMPAFNLEKPVQSNKLDKLAEKEKLQSKHEKFQSRDVIENNSVNSPDSDSLYTAIPLESASNSWNDLNSMVFGNFHQNDATFPEQSRGYQCTCNALCMLAYSICLDVEKSSVLDKVLCEGDTLYQSVISKLKEDGKFIQHLLSLEEIPDYFEVDIGKFTLERLPIVCGVLVDTQDHGLPTLHSALQSAFLSVSSGLITIGAICFAVFGKNGLYVFFDSHSHGENGLSSIDGASCLITFSNLDGLVAYLYAFYDSMKLDMTDNNLQFDFLPVNVKRSEEKQSYTNKMQSNLEAYFNDQRLRQANKAQRNVRSMSKNVSSILIDESKKASGAKKKKKNLPHRTEYQKAYKRKSRQNSAFKLKEREAKQSVRKDPAYKAKEREAKQSVRKDLLYKTNEREAKQSVRKDPVHKTKEREAMRSVRKNPVYKAREREAKQSVRKDPVHKTKEREAMRSVRNNPVYKAREREAKQSVRKDPVHKTKEREAMRSVRKKPCLKSKRKRSKAMCKKRPCP